MNNLRDLYQEVIIDHGRHPRNCHALQNANCQGQGYNPLCGDQITFYLQINDGVVSDASFEGTGCAISIASASLMSEHIKGKTIAEIEQLFQSFHQLLVENQESVIDLGKLTVLSGVKAFPMRVKCATLAWHAMLAALHQETKPVSTEGSI